nr:UbiX family flavin prenyltransferase [uncultured Campylobacter sp.]
MKIFLGISGASGVNLGLKLASEIAKRSELHLCVSKNAMNVLEKELNFTDIFYKNGATGLKFNANQSSAKFDKDHEDAKFANFSSAQGELDFGGGDEISQDENGKFSDSAKDLGSNILKFDGLENYALDDTNGQICKFDGGEKNKWQDAQILGKFDGGKFQNKSEFDKNSAQKDEIYQIWQDLQKYAAIHDDSDLTAAPSSGSFGIDATIVVPCSINTLAKIHAGFADMLITRAAAVALKERKRLILGVREMPFSTLALEHAAKLSALGAVIAPPVLGYYSGQNSLEDMENFIIGKWLDLLGLEHQIYKRWG